ncbi:hypothetical protein [Pseudoalteromonas sp. ASV78]
MADIQLFKYFESIDDPRQQGKVVHKLFDIIILAIEKKGLFKRIFGG